jgi:hypothetical protein
MPLPICAPAREKRSQLGSPLGAAKGYCAAKKMYYYGLKLHAIIDDKMTISQYWLTPANVHDVRALEEAVSNNLKDTLIFGDKAYNSQRLAQRLVEEQNCMLLPIRKKNQKIWDNTPEENKWKSKNRKIVESFFSKLSALMPKRITAVKPTTYLRKIGGFILAMNFL